MWTPNLSILLSLDIFYEKHYRLTWAYESEQEKSEHRNGTQYPELPEQYQQTLFMFKYRIPLANKLGLA